MPLQGQGQGSPAIGATRLQPLPPPAGAEEGTEDPETRPCHSLCPQACDFSPRLSEPAPYFTAWLPREGGTGGACVPIAP